MRGDTGGREGRAAARVTDLTIVLSWEYRLATVTNSQISVMNVSVLDAT
jgi:hypothetical protein